MENIFKSQRDKVFTHCDIINRLINIYIEDGGAGSDLGKELIDIREKNKTRVSSR